LCFGGIVAVENPFLDTLVPGANELAASKRTEIEILSKVNGGLGIED